jgi:hypothetical protein
MAWLSASSELEKTTAASGDGGGNTVIVKTGLSASNINTIINSLVNNNTFVARIAGDPAIITAVINSPQFQTTIEEYFGNPEFITNLVNNSAFVASVTNALAVNATLITSIVTSPDFLTFLNSPGFINSLVGNTAFLSEVAQLLSGNAAFINSIINSASFQEFINSEQFTDSIINSAAFQSFLSSGTFVTELANNSTFVTNVAQSETFISGIVNSEVFQTFLGDTLVQSIIGDTSFINSICSNSTFITGIVNSDSFQTFLNSETFIEAITGNEQFLASVLALVADIIVADKDGNPVSVRSGKQIRVNTAGATLGLVRSADNNSLDTFNKVAFNENGEGSIHAGYLDEKILFRTGAVNVRAADNSFTAKREGQDIVLPFYLTDTEPQKPVKGEIYFIKQ